MKLTTLKKLIFEKNIFGSLKLSKNIQHLYKTSFVVAARSSGLLKALASGGKTLSELQQLLEMPAGAAGSLEAWLECGIKYGELKYRDGRYLLKGSLSKHLAKEANATAAAMLEEVVRYHYDATLNAPQRMREQQRYSLADQDGDLIAQSSRILEPFVEEAIDWVLDGDGNGIEHVLEVGCGSGYYLNYMKQKKAALRIDAIDYQQEVVEAAQHNLETFGLADCIDVSHQSVFELQQDQHYDLVTLHNNIYYFAPEQQPELFAKVFNLLAPDGKLLLTTSCQGGSPAIAALNLWWKLSETDTGLPQNGILQQHLQQAGFVDVECRRLLPGESYFAFVATKPWRQSQEKTSEEIAPMQLAS